MRHRFVAEALAEFIAAGRYYNRQVPGLGDAFVEEVEAGIEVILNGPDVWRVIKEDVRRYSVVLHAPMLSKLRFFARQSATPRIATQFADWPVL